MSDANRQKLVDSMKVALTKITELNSKYQGQDMPAEVSKQIDSLLSESDACKAQIEVLDRISKGQAFLDDSQGSSAMHHGWRESTKDEGDFAVDEKSWREVEVKTGSGAFAKSQTFRYHVPLAVQAKEYPSAFEAYCRKGFSDMGPRDRKTLQEGVDSLGGFLVPPDTLGMMVKKIATLAVVRQYAKMITTSRDRVQVPRRKYTADDKYTSPARITWTGELPATATVHRASEPDYGMVTIPVHTAMASLPVSIDLIQDSAYDIEAEITGMLGESFALGEEDVFWNGSGAGRPMGILHDVDGTNGVKSVASGDANLLTADGLITLVYDLPSQYESGARIFWKKATELAVRLMKNTTTNEYVWPVEERVGGFGVPERTIQGVPISRTEFVDSVAAGNHPVVMGNLSGYTIVDRVGLSIQRLTEMYAEQNMIVLLGKKRVGGQLVEPWKIRVQEIGA